MDKNSTGKSFRLNLAKIPGKILIHLFRTPLSERDSRDNSFRVRFSFEVLRLKILLY